MTVSFPVAVVIVEVEAGVLVSDDIAIFIWLLGSVKNSVTFELISVANLARKLLSLNASKNDETRKKNPSRLTILGLILSKFT
jgi:hypothetical protein